MPRRAYLPPPTIHTSTSSRSLSTDLGSKASSTSAKWRGIESEKARRWPRTGGRAMRGRSKPARDWKLRRASRGPCDETLAGLWRSRLAVTDLDEGIVGRGGGVTSSLCRRGLFGVVKSGSGVTLGSRNLDIYLYRRDTSGSAAMLSFQTVMAVPRSAVVPGGAPPRSVGTRLSRGSRRGRLGEPRSANHASCIITPCSVYRTPCRSSDDPSTWRKESPYKSSQISTRIYTEILSTYYIGRYIYIHLHTSPTLLEIAVFKAPPPPIHPPL